MFIRINRLYAREGLWRTAFIAMRDQVRLLLKGDVEPVCGPLADSSVGVKQVGSLKFFHGALGLRVIDACNISGIKTLLLQSFLQVADVISGLAVTRLGRHADTLLSSLGRELFIPLVGGTQRFIVECFRLKFLEKLRNGNLARKGL